MRYLNKWIVWLVIIVFSFTIVSSFALCFLSVISGINRTAFLDWLGICLVLTVASIVMLVFYRIGKAFACIFDDAEIKFSWCSFTYRRVPYTKIEGIAVVGARDVGYLYNIPILDDNKKQKAALVLYSINISVLGNGSISSDSQSWLGSSRGSDILCSSLFEKENLKMLLNKTALPIYVTEHMLVLYQDLLEDLLELYPNRFVIAYYDKIKKAEKKLPYKHYVVYKHENALD